MTENNPKGKSNIDKFKEELLSSESDVLVTKESKAFFSLRAKTGDKLKPRFSFKNAEKEFQKKHSIKNKSRFDKAAKPKKTLINLFSELVLKMGIEENARDFNKKVLRGVLLFHIVLSILLVAVVIYNEKSFGTLILFLILLWTLAFVITYLFTILAIFVYFDIKMYQHVNQIEESLPDFLQLASANISAGMTVDRALWYAVRPKFGILAVEMENVAKSTIAGEDIEIALSTLAKKYDSRMLKETMNLLVEGIQSGGEMAQLLGKLSANIKETQLMRKEIGASVTTYAIFIGVATVLAAPALFALSTQLLIIIQSIFSTIGLDNSSGMSSSFSFSFTGDSVKISDFKRFAVLVLVISSFFSAAIISVIRKGSIKDGVKLIPIFMIISITLYYLSTMLFAALMGGLF